MSNEVWRETHKEELRKYRRDWYYRNREHAISKINERIDLLKKWMKEYKSGLKCEKCGMSNPLCLVFHHKNPKEKETNLSQAAHNGWSIQRILKEIQKCEVLCANCHLILHASEEDFGKTI